MIGNILHLCLLHAVKDVCFVWHNLAYQLFSTCLYCFFLLGSEYTFDAFFISARNIRYVHIPDHLSVKELLETELAGLLTRPTCADRRNTFKVVRAERYQKETLESMKKWYFDKHFNCCKFNVLFLTICNEFLKRKTCNCGFKNCY